MRRLPRWSNSRAIIHIKWPTRRSGMRLYTGATLLSLALSCWPAPAADDAKTWRPEIPQVWEDAALAEWPTPLAGLHVRPTHIASKEYYSLIVDNLRTYPVYFPGREPAGYWEMLKHLGPKPLIDPGKRLPAPSGTPGYKCKNRTSRW